MRLRKIDYREHEDTPQQWSLDGLTLGDCNLIVGKNASGKSRALNVISGLAKNLAGLTKPAISGAYKCEFSNQTDTLIYEYSVKRNLVLKERLTVNGNVVLDRGGSNGDRIWAVKLDQFLEFESPKNVLCAVAKRDTIQHPFLEPLYRWASTLRHYTFGTPLGKEHFAVLVKNGGAADARDQNAVVGLLRQALRDHGEEFQRMLKADLNRVAYNINSIAVGPPVSFTAADAPGDLVGINVNEGDMPGITDQFSMSQGMFRVVSLLIHLNYCALTNSGSMVLIDDIGEGLDFDRSCRLIALLREKSRQSNIQLVMSTNDRFVMNEVPLDEWTVLQRIGNRVKVHNSINSREKFESFRFTGLSNFSFLEMDFINTTDQTVH